MQENSQIGISAQVLTWVADVLKPQASILSVKQLHGGMSSLVYSLVVQEENAQVEYVLRQFDNAEWLAQEPDLARHEAASLHHAALADVSVPRIRAYDGRGARSGMPAVLMSKLPGAVVLSPPDIAGWLEGMAEALAQIHRVGADDFPWEYFAYMKLEEWVYPAWSTLSSGIWEEIIRLQQGPVPPYQPCFIHRDYHPTNILWEGRSISGVVDWVNACRGPAGADVGHCRLNLASLYGVEAADAFLAAYQRYAGDAFRYDVYWDIRSLVDTMFGEPTVYPGWTALGFAGLTDKLMVERADRYVTSLMK